MKKLKLVDNDICIFCKSEVEIIEYIFIFCFIVFVIWNSLSMYIYNIVLKRVGFNVINVLFGEVFFLKLNLVINFLILFIK